VGEDTAPDTAAIIAGLTVREFFKGTGGQKHA